MHHFDNSAETGYIGRGDIGVIVIEVIADPNDDLISQCCSGDGVVVQPMLQWAIEYDSAFIDRRARDVCYTAEENRGRDLIAVDCAPDALIAAWDASERALELGFPSTFVAP